MTSQNPNHAANDKTDFDDLIQRLRSDDPQAAAEVWGRFVEPLLKVAHQHLDDALRAKVDADDIVQSAYRTFFMRFRKGQFELTNWSSLLGLLVCITKRKCLRKAEHYHTQQRDVGHELPLDAGDAAARPFSRNGAEPSPDEHAITTEIVEQLARELTKPYERQVLCRLLEGWSVPDISADVGRSEYTVHRVESRLKLRLEQMRDEE